MVKSEGETAQPGLWDPATEPNPTHSQVCVLKAGLGYAGFTEWQERSTWQPAAFLGV